MELIAFQNALPVGFHELSFLYVWIENNQKFQESHRALHRSTSWLDLSIKIRFENRF